ncbi:MAG: hypothetical protein H7A23_01240 [Leptospiraceae bacterium]|nr:hypothetical protein [Leptospiraceae bacterium]MCP5493156.1 hypothetical protein [Leptospiraceae bacterium]
MSEEKLNFEVNQRTELQRLCHLLNSNEEELDYLARLSANELFFLRNKFSDAMQNEHAETWEKLAKVTKYMPNFISAMVAQDILGPSITANLTYHMPVKEAISISSHFSVKFMADVTEHLVPSKLEALLKEFPIDRIKKIIEELEKRKGYYTMGNFVDYIPSDRVMAIANQIHSEETMVRTATFSNKKDRLVPVIANFSDERLKKLILTASNLNLCEDVLVLVRFIPETELHRYLGIIVMIGGEVFANYLATVKKMGGEELEKVRSATDKLGIQINW